MSLLGSASTMGGGGGVSAVGISNTIANKSNCKIVYPGDNLQTAYNWLKSADRNAVMGVISETQEVSITSTEAGLTINGIPAIQVNYTGSLGVLRGCVVTLSGSNIDGTYPVTAVASGYFYIPGTYAATTTGTVSLRLVNNPRTLLLMPGRYVLSAILEIDTDGVYLAGTGDPKATVVHKATGGTIRQTAWAIAMYGITVSNADKEAFQVWEHGNVHPRAIESYYRNCHFSGNYGVWGRGDLVGFWENCHGVNGAAIWSVAASGGFLYENPKGFNEMGGVFHNCTAGPWSFGHDIGRLSAEMHGCTAKEQSFGGCVSVGIPITDWGEFYNCVAGDNSFGLGRTVTGKFYNCIGGRDCFAGSSHATLDLDGDFNGLAVNCHATGNSFGGRSDGTGTGKCSGTLIDCTTNRRHPMATEGARIEDCHVTVIDSVEDDSDCIVLNDSSSKIYNSTLIAKGTGKSIATDGTARSVVSAHNRMNTGLGSGEAGVTVTNLIGTSYDVVDADIA